MGRITILRGRHLYSDFALFYLMVVLLILILLYILIVNINKNIYKRDNYV